MCNPLQDAMDIPCGCCDRNEEWEPCPIEAPSPWTVTTPSAPNPAPIISLPTGKPAAAPAPSAPASPPTIVLTPAPSPLLGPTLAPNAPSPSSSSPPPLSSPTASVPSPPTALTPPSPSTGSAPPPPSPDYSGTQNDGECSTCSSLFGMAGRTMTNASCSTEFCIPTIFAFIFQLFGFGCGSCSA